MRTQSKIILKVPTIDLVECRKFKGGYYEYWGGVLDPGYCEADGHGDDYPDADDGWLPDYDFVNPEDYEEWKDDMPQHDEDNRHDGDDDRGNDGNNENNTVTYDDSIPKEMQAQINSLLNNLPPNIANQNVRIILNSDLLDSLSEKWNQDAKGAFLHAGYVLPDGTKLSEDTILLGNGADMTTIQEELIHCWQVNNCIYSETSMNEVISAMEFQASVIEAINILEHSDNIIELPTGIPEYFAEFYYSLFDDGEIEFDYASFEEMMNEFYDAWVEFYTEIDEEHPYANGDDEKYNWNWEDLLYEFIN